MQIIDKTLIVGVLVALGLLIIWAVKKTITTPRISLANIMLKGRTKLRVTFGIGHSTMPEAIILEVNPNAVFKHRYHLEPVGYPEWADDMSALLLDMIPDEYGYSYPSGIYRIRGVQGLFVGVGITKYSLPLHQAILVGWHITDEKNTEVLKAIKELVAERTVKA